MNRANVSRSMDHDAGLTVHATVARHGDMDDVLGPSDEASGVEGSDPVNDGAGA